MNRRSFLASILAAGVAPAVIGSGILMPVRKLIDPYAYLRDPSEWYIQSEEGIILQGGYGKLMWPGIRAWIAKAYGDGVYEAAYGKVVRLPPSYFDLLEPE